MQIPIALAARIGLGIIGCSIALWPAQAAVFSPRAVPAHQADTYSLKTFAQFAAWKDLSGDAKVYRIFEYLSDPRTGIYPMGVPAREGSETLNEYGAVRDPVKMLNVYPLGHCGTLGPTMAGLMEGLGIGPARTLILPGWNHVASEVFYGGQWHYLDLDVRAAFRRPDGSLASLQEAQRDDTLWQQPSRARFFPLDDLSQVQQACARTPVEHRYGFSSGGHTMDFVLRQGERFTRWWQPQGGRWNHHPSYAARPFPRNLLEQEPRGPKSKHPSFTQHTHGNGRWVYRPDLTSHSTDFVEGAYAAQNVQPGPTGLTLKTPGTGHAIFEVRSPYVIVPRVGDLDRGDDDCEASVVRLDADHARLWLSQDHGISWRDLGPAARELDLTSRVAGTYGYLLKVGLQGGPETAVVRQLEITTWVQLHPAALPALRQGTNVLRYVNGDHYGLNTRVVEIRPETANREALLKHLVEPPKDYDPARQTSRIRGPMVAKIAAPPGTKIAWFSAGASFATHQRAQAGQTRNTIAYAVERPAEFTEIYRAAVPEDQAHWHYNVDQEVRLAEPARRVLVRYIGDPAVNQLRLYAHCVDDVAPQGRPVRITQAWTENGRLKTNQVQLETAGEYAVTTVAEPINQWIELSVPSQAAASPAQPPAEGRAIHPSFPAWLPPAPPLPAPTGAVQRVATTDELVAALDRVPPGTAILLVDGHYSLPRYVEIRADNVTLRSASGQRERVILDGSRSRHGELLGLTRCAGVTVADLTIQNVRWNGLKLNSDTGVQRVTVHNCVFRNIWQRAIKGVKVPAADRERLRPTDCRIEHCLFVNERPKQFADDPADRADNFNGNYVGGIDVMYAKGWRITDNVFVGLQGRTRAGRGAVFLWHEAEDCLVERNVIVDCDVGIALGNSHRSADVPVHATRCVVRNNFITRAPETGLLADYTKDCRILHNSIHDPANRLGRLIRLVHDNDGLVVAHNLLHGPPLRNESASPIRLQQNLVSARPDAFRDPAVGDLHLTAPAPAVADRAAGWPDVSEDIDRQPRGKRPDIGADEFVASDRATR